MDDQGHGMDSREWMGLNRVLSMGQLKIHTRTCVIGGAVMGPDRILAWQALPPTSSPPPSAAGARGSHTRIFQDPQALPALPLGPMPLKRQPQQAL